MTFARLAAGLCDVREGKVQSGIDGLQQALIAAEGLALASLTIDALFALAWGYEVAGQPGRALIVVRRIIDYYASARRMCLNALEWQADGRSEDSPWLMPLKLRAANLEAASAKLTAQMQRFAMLERLAMAATLRDDPSGLHGYRVGRLSGLLAADIAWAPDRCYELESAARLHDIGKSALPDHILLRTGPLKSAEREFIRSHPELGASILSNPSDPDTRLASDVALYHHEHWNGQGYPKGLAGHRIPIAARIVAIADVFDALTHGRPYARTWPIDNALIEIRALAGLQFDPEITGRFIALINNLIETHGDLDSFLEASARSSPFFSARSKIQALVAHVNCKAEFS